MRIIDTVIENTELSSSFVYTINKQLNKKDTPLLAYNLILWQMY